MRQCCRIDGRSAFAEKPGCMFAVVAIISLAVTFAALNSNLKTAVNFNK